MTDVEAPRRGRPPNDDPRREARPEMRVDPRSADLERAAARAEQLRDHLGDSDQGTDDFYIDPAIVPAGWTYEWKRDTILGAPDPAYSVQLARAGWEPVSVLKHPEYMPVGYKGKTIERKGMVLMERPSEIVEQAKKRDLRNARMQVAMKEEQLSGAPDGQFERANKGEPLAKINKTYEAIPIPD